MKRHTAILLTALLCLLALFSCAPVEYPAALERNVVEEKPVIYVTPHAKKAEVSFAPVRNADSYKITLNDEVMSVPLKVKDGLYTFTIRKLEPDKSYDLKVSAINSKGSIESVRSFTTLVDNGELDYAPIAYMSYRDTNNAKITIELRKDMEYIVSLERDGKWEQVPKTSSSDNKAVYEIINLDKDTFYNLRVDHKRISDTKYSSEFTSLIIPKFRTSFSNDYELMMTDTTIRLGSWIDGKFVDAPDLAGKNITLLFYPDGSGIPEIMETKDGKVPAFDVARVGVLRSGLFDVVVTDMAGNNPVFYTPDYFTTPILPVKNTAASNQTTVTLTWTQPDDMEDIIYTVSGNSTDNKWAIKPSEVEVVGNTATLKLDDLVSNTDYELHIEALLPNEDKSNTTYTFTTESFSGVYRWVCPTPNAKVPSFVIEVWDEEDAKNKGWEGTWNKDFPYHVFVHESDPAYSESMKGVPIMPLFESTEEIPSENISYADGDKHFQIGYRWNEAKWNTTTQKPSEWYPVKNDIEGDHIASYCDSWPMIGKVSTKTNFDFRVKDGKPQLVFRNAGDGPKAGFVNLGLFKNPAPEPGTDKFTYVLNRIGSVE